MKEYIHYFDTEDQFYEEYENNYDEPWIGGGEK